MSTGRGSWCSCGPTRSSSTSATPRHRCVPRSAAIAKYDKQQAAVLRERGQPCCGLVAVHGDESRATAVHGERRYSVAPGTGGARASGAGFGARAEPNHVMLGSQGVKGVPVGAEAHFAGGMIFTAELIDSPIGKGAGARRQIRRRSRRGCRSRSGSPGTRHRGILVLDTGLRTDWGGGVRRRASVPDMRPAALAMAADRPEHDRRRGRVRRRQERHARLRGRSRHVHHRHHPADLPGRRGAHRRRALELRRRRRRQRDRRVPARRRAGRRVRHRRDEPRRVHGATTTACCRRGASGRLLGDGLCIAAAGNQSTSLACSSRRRRPPSSGVGGLAPKRTRRGSRTSAAGSMQVHRPSTSSARLRAGDETASKLSEPPFTGGARSSARASRRRRSPPRWRWRCTSGRNPAPSHRGSGCRTIGGTASPTSASCSTSDVVADLVEFEGPLGALAPELSLSLIVVRGRPCRAPVPCPP